MSELQQSTIAEFAPDSSLEPENGKPIQDICALIRAKYDEYCKRTGVNTLKEAGRRMQINAYSTLSLHMRRNRDFESRTLAAICNELDITQDELAQITNLQILGLQPEERRRILDALEPLVTGGPELFDEQILAELSFAHPEMLQHAPQVLVPIIAEVRKRHDIEDPRTPLLQEINGLDKRLRNIGKREAEERIRHFEIGNMFEQVALLDYQIGGQSFVPEYCLSATRDDNGRVTHTTDILDLVIQDPAHGSVMERAYMEHANADRENPISKIDDGKVVMDKVDESGKTFFYYEPDGAETERIEILQFDTPESVVELKGGLAARYDTGEGRQRIVYELEMDDEHLLPKFGFFMAESVEDDNRIRWQHNRPLTGIEIKKAGSKNGVNRIKKQLAGQRQAILRHQGDAPLSIPGMVNHINVVVLNPNRPLQQAVEALNEEGPAFFNYVEFSGIGSSFCLSHERLQNRTLPEVKVLKRFFQRVNDELSAKPTLRPLAEQSSKHSNPILDSFLEVDGEEKRLLERVRSILEESDRRKREEEEHKAKEERVQQAQGLMEEFEAFLGSTTRNKSAGEALETVLEQDLAVMFERHFSTPYTQPSSMRTAMTVHEEHNGTLLAYPRKFQARSHAVISGVDLLEQAQKIAAAHGIEIDLQDLESLQELLEYLAEEVERREAEQARRDALEKQFSIRTVDCQIGQYEAERDRRFGERFSSYTPLECGALSGIRREITGANFDTDRAASQEMLLACRVQMAAVLSDPPVEDRAVSSAARSAFNERRDAPCFFEQGIELNQALHAFFSSVFTELQQADSARIGTLLSEWRREIGRIGKQYEEALHQTTSVHVPIDLEHGHASRHSLDLHLGARLEKALSEGPMQSLAGNSEMDMPDIEHPSPDDIAVLQPHFWAQFYTPHTDPNNLQACKQEVNTNVQAMGIEDATRAIAPIMEMLSRVMASSRTNVDAAALTKLTLAEQRILYEFGLRMLEHAVTLHDASPQLARDYVSTSIHAFTTHPEVYSDLYIDKYVRINEALKQADTADIHQYLAFVAHREDTEDTAHIQGEFLRRLVTLSMQEHLPIAEYNPPLCTGVTTVLDHIRQGAAAADTQTRDTHFEQAYALYRQAENPTRGVTLRTLRQESEDPHLRWIRRWQERTNHRTEMAEETKTGAFADSFHESVDTVIRLTSERDMERWKKTKEANDPRLREELHTLLSTFTEVSRLKLRAQPESNITESMMFHASFFRGFRCYDQAQRAVRYVRDNAPELPVAYMNDTADVVAHALYLHPERTERMRDITQAHREQRANEKVARRQEKGEDSNGDTPAVSTPVSTGNGQRFALPPKITAAYHHAGRAKSKAGSHRRL